MSLKAIQDRVVAIVRSVSVASKEIGHEELLGMPYLERGLIDSFEVLDMIAKIEEEFNIKFSAAHLSSDSFRTLRGVSSVVEQLIENSRSNAAN